MSRRVLGRAAYKAYRLFGVLHLIAVGETPNLNDKVDFEQLPFRIFPPMFGFYFIQQDISLPATKPFVYEESVAYPQGVNLVRIQDADGIHDVPIADVVPVETEAQRSLVGADGNYCVFSWIGINTMMIAKCDAIVPAVYTRVFGPSTYEGCQAYIRDHGGIAPPDGGTIEVLEDTFRAWIDLMPPGPHKLIVTGDVVTPTSGWSVTLAPAVPQGINPDILILDVTATPPSGISRPVRTKVPVRFQESPPQRTYTQVSIRHAGAAFTIGVGITH
jgi:hypothetical protein